MESERAPFLLPPGVYQSLHLPDANTIPDPVLIFLVEAISSLEYRYVAWPDAAGRFLREENFFVKQK
jgi:hypothetical protein